MKIILTESQVGSLRERIWAHIQKGEGAKFNWADGDLEKADKVSVPLSKLKFNQPKSDEKEKEYQDKVDGIKKHYKKDKKVMPMLVHKVKGGYEIIDGHHRYTALKQMGIKNAKVIIVPEKNVKYKKNLNLQEDDMGYTMLPMDNIRRPNGSVGTQGFTPESIINLVRHISDVYELNLPEYESLKDLIYTIREQPEVKDAIMSYVKRDPISVIQLPDETYHLKDGNHRANLLNLLHFDSVPAILK
jgi:hypothetical protein